jgi:hypothetical protein
MAHPFACEMTGMTQRVPKHEFFQHSECDVEDKIKHGYLP